jgi:hypothetical protein
MTSGSLTSSGAAALLSDVDSKANDGPTSKIRAMFSARSK